MVSFRAFSASSGETASGFGSALRCGSDLVVSFRAIVFPFILPPMRPSPSWSVVPLRTRIMPQPESLRRLHQRRDRKSVVEGKSVYVRVDFGGERFIKKNKQITD